MDFKKAAEKYYFEYGMNILNIRGEQSRYLSFVSAEMSGWKNYLDKRLPEEDFLRQDWSNATGFGIVLGYGDYRALVVYYRPEYSGKASYLKDMDNDILYLLRRLGLPEDYEWVVFCGDGLGFSIIFRTVQPSICDCPTFMRGEYSNRRGAFLLKWREFLVLPPSINGEGMEYEFRFGTAPSSNPEYVLLNDINRLISDECVEQH